MAENALVSCWSPECVVPREPGNVYLTWEETTMPSEKEYFIRKRKFFSKIEGPYTLIELKAIAKVGFLTPDYQISPNQKKWQSAVGFRPALFPELENTSDDQETEEVQFAKRSSKAPPAVVPETNQFNEEQLLAIHQAEKDTKGRRAGWRKHVRRIVSWIIMRELVFSPFTIRSVIRSFQLDSYAIRDLLLEGHLTWEHTVDQSDLKSDYIQSVPIYRSRAASEYPVFVRVRPIAAYAILGAILGFFAGPLLLFPWVLSQDAEYQPLSKAITETLWMFFVALPIIYLAWRIITAIFVVLRLIGFGFLDELLFIPVLITTVGLFAVVMCFVMVSPFSVPPGLALGAIVGWCRSWFLTRLQLPENFRKKYAPASISRFVTRVYSLFRSAKNKED